MHSSAELWGPSPLPEPAWEHRFRSDLPWADVVADDRGWVSLREAPPPEVLPEPGLDGYGVAGTSRMSGRATVPWPPPLPLLAMEPARYLPRGYWASPSAAGRPGRGWRRALSPEPVPDPQMVLLTAHQWDAGAHSAQIYRIQFPDGWTGAAICGYKPHYPDGNRLRQLGHYFATYLGMGFATAFTTGVSASNDSRDRNLWLIQNGLLRWRQAMEDPHGWYGTEIPLPNPNGTHYLNVGSEIRWASLGFGSHADALEVVPRRGAQHLQDVWPALQIGFSPAIAADRLWWGQAHQERWAQAIVSRVTTDMRHWDWLYGLYRAGWTRGAMHHLNDAARATLRERDPDRIPEEPTRDEWERWSGYRKWMALTDDPVVASACLELGIGLAEAKRMAASETGLDRTTLQVLVALRG